MVRWAGIHHTVPCKTWWEFQLQGFIVERRRDCVVACSQRLDKGDSPWSYRDLSFKWNKLSIPQALPGNAHHTRFVILYSPDLFHSSVDYFSCFV